ncbi:putative phospholipid-transporting ATPase IF [Nymphon striatum]|nr:putative phospholipid-transporting ATPase IF [Nymphon striatum]
MQLGQGPPNAYRTVYIANQPPPSSEVFIPHKFPDNCVITSKYTAWNFLYKNLYEQFRRIANLYFLCIAVIQLSIKSPVSPATSLIPLIFVVSITAVKQAYEDWLRHKADKLVNECKVSVVRDGKLVSIMSKDITVGDFVRVKADEGFPCDLVLISSSEKDGQCLITTANLDGETNLKVLNSLPATRVFNTVDSLCNIHASIECHEPSTDLYKFIGRMNTYQADGMPPIVTTLGPENLLLKGARLKNTPYIFVHTGQHTKMALNSKLTPNKFSTVENANVITIKTIMATPRRQRITAIEAQRLIIDGLEDDSDLDDDSSESSAQECDVSYQNRADESSDDNFDDMPDGDFQGILEDFFAFLVLFNYIIPISLYVSVEMVKFVGSMYFVWDMELYDESTNQIAKCNSSDLNEELGQRVNDGLPTEDYSNILSLVDLILSLPVQSAECERVFSNMKLVKSDWRSVLKSKNLSDQLMVILATNDIDQYDPLPAIRLWNSAGSKPRRPCTAPYGVEYLFSDKTGTLTENDMQFRRCSINGIHYVEKGGLLCEISNNDSEESNPLLGQYSKDVLSFLEVLALCHTVHLSTNIDKPVGVINGIDLGLCNFFEYQASSPDEKALVEACRRFRIVYQGLNNDHYELNINGKIKKFKRLHVLEFDSNRRRMSVIIQNEKREIYLLCKGAESALLNVATSGSIEATRNHVDEFAVLGLRTLVIACRKLSPEQYDSFNNDLKNARNALTDREFKVMEVFEQLEQDLHILGATAVEDRLQDGVAETLESLRIAGIKIWILTGDKQETAVNISHSCGHFKPTMIQIKVTQQKSSEDCGHNLAKIKRSLLDNPTESFSLVVDGMSLSYALSDHSELFCDVCQACTAVLCCRMSPMQKSQVVKLIKNTPELPITAAIGDGANDVSMIQEAHVGLGIMGKEGRQATRCSDFAFARFKFLLRVLLVHGQYYYIRVANLVQYFFYKTIYHSIFLMFYNIFFSSLPILIYGISEQHLKPSVLLANPALYKTLSRNAKLSPARFFIWVFIGIWHSLVFFFGVYFLYSNDVLQSKGETDGMLTFGTLVFHICVITVNLKLCLHTRYWTIVFFLSIVASVLGFILFSFLYCGIKWPLPIEGSQTALYWVYMQLFISPNSHLCTIMLIVIALIPDVAFIIIDNNQPSNIFDKDVRKKSIYKPAFELAQNSFETTPLRPQRFKKNTMVAITSFPPPTEGIILEETNVKLIIDKKTIGTGTLYIAESRVSWRSGDEKCVSIEYLAIEVHAISRDTNAFPDECLYLMIDAKLDETVAENEDEENDPEDRPDSEILFIPEDKDALEAMYKAIVVCQELHPDPNDSISEEEAEEDEFQSNGDGMDVVQFEDAD